MLGAAETRAAMSRNPLRSAVLATIFLFVASFLFCWRELWWLSEASVTEGKSDLLRLLHSELELSGWRALARADLVAGMPEVQKALASRDRATLLRLTEPGFDVQRKKYGITQANFYTQDDVAFLRLESPEAHGDSVAEYRAQVVHTNRSAEPHAGPGVGRYGPDVFGVVPVFHAGKPVGCFEFGLSYQSVVDRLHANFGLEAAALFDRQLLTEISNLVRWDTSPDNLSGANVRIASSDWKVLQELLGQQQLEYLREPITYVGSFQNRDYTVAVVPLTDLSGRAVGQLVAARELPPFRVKVRNAAVMAACGCLVALFITCGVLQIAIRGGLVWPARYLARRLDQMANGENPPPADDLERESPALKDLFRAYNRLRDQERM